MDQGAMVLEEGVETSPDPHSEGKQELVYLETCDQHCFCSQVDFD